jgi:predicted RNA-binding Zn ribbon-like protein
MTAPPLKYIGGNPALDLVNTVDWTRDGPRAERLPDYARLLDWSAGVGVVSPAVARRLRRAAARRPGAAGAALVAAHRTRGLLQRLLAARAGGQAPAEPDLAGFNTLLSGALEHLELAASPSGMRLGWRGLGDQLASPLWPVVWSAARLLASEEAERIRVCAGPDCGWMYVDRSRNGLRRWCEMETCGTREKNRRRASAR